MPRIAIHENDAATLRLPHAPCTLMAIQIDQPTIFERNLPYIPISNARQVFVIEMISNISDLLLSQHKQ